jgi:hypothetical protein
MGKENTLHTAVITGPDMSRRGFLAGALATGFLLRGDSLRRVVDRDAEKTSLVTVRNGQFFRNGSAFRVLGENWYSLGEDNTQANNKICGPILSTGQKEGWLKDVASLGMNVVRYWDFPELTADGRDETAIDQVVTQAAERGLLVYPTLENNFPNCDGISTQKPMEWYKTGYKDVYLPYVKEMAKKYKGDSRIFAFQLINEAQCEDHGVLKEFAYTVLEAVKEIDPDRLVTLGLLGVNQPGTAGTDFKDLFVPPVRTDHKFDFIDIHDWPGSEDGTFNGLPGDEQNGIYTRLETAKQLNMPLVISEIGRVISDGLTPQQIAQKDKSQIEKLLEYRNFAGLVGWSLAPPQVAADGIQYYGVGSPEAQMLKQMSRSITHI